jgi:ComF family protein
VNCKKLVSIKLFRYFADYKDKEIKGVIEDFKFYDKFSFYKVIANVIFELIYKDKINNYRGSAIVCALPTSYKRARERGYDQAELIAKELAKLLGVRYREVFFRFKSKIKQKNLNRQGRALNAENIFMISPKFRLGGGVKTIILVDDIVTTGSTFNAAADLLASRLNNKISIIGLSFARTPSENEI